MSILIVATKEENRVLNIAACKVRKKKRKEEWGKERKTGRLGIQIYSEEEKLVGKQGKRRTLRAGCREVGARGGCLAEGATVEEEGCPG